MMIALLPLLGMVMGEVVTLHGQPKSGTTWMEVIVKTLGMASCGPGMACDEFIDGTATQRVYTMGDMSVEIGHKHYLPGGIGRAAGMLGYVNETYENLGLSNCTVIWSETCLPWSLYEPIVDKRAILIVRDPRAVVVSAYHYFPILRGNASLEDYFLNQVPMTAALTSVRYWWHDFRIRETIPSLILFYEDLLDDTINQYFRIASFLRLVPSMETMRSVVNATSATTMQQLEEDGKIPGVNHFGQENAKVRSAQAQAYREEILALPDGDDILRNATRAMAPFLHPALQARYLYTYSEDIAALS